MICNYCQGSGEYFEDASLGAEVCIELVPCSVCFGKGQVRKPVMAFLESLEFPRKKVKKMSAKEALNMAIEKAIFQHDSKRRV